MANAAMWSKRVAQWRASGMTAGTFCGERGLAVASLRYWSCRLGRKAEGPGTPQMRMARVEVALPESLCAGGESRAAESARGICLEVGRVRVVIERGFDEKTLASVLGVVLSRMEGGAQ